ncbi:mammalian cell entry protein [Mycobacterium sp.]|uniref:mammalian cell entry protein n=1 Tax=Mycobacterium sp. TaxID=1785 RepID=UPI002D8CF0CC|nr:mammalian cell entry protein [Mycobacterium sp.]
MEDQPADSGDLTTGAAEKDEATAAKARRWWRFGRQDKATEPSVDESTDATAESTEPEEPKPQSRKPVGKSGRTATPVAPAEPATEDEPIDSEEPVEESAETEATESEEAPESDVILVPHRPAGKRLKIAAMAAAALFVGAVAFAAATLQPYLADRALVDTKLDVARTAANAITTLWTYTPENMDSLPDRSATYLGGDFANEYRKYIDAIVAPNKQAQVTNTTQVMGAAVETLTPSEATAIVYTNSVATSPVTKNIPSRRYLSYRLTMQRHDAKWLITKMSTVTSLDLTPRL